MSEPLIAGMWYVSNLTTVTETSVGIGSLPSKRYSDYIVGGPFSSEREAEEFKANGPYFLTGIVWRYR